MGSNEKGGSHDGSFDMLSLLRVIAAGGNVAS